MEEDRAGRVDREQVENLKIVDFSAKLEEVAIASINIGLQTSLINLSVELVGRAEDARASAQAAIDLIDRTITLHFVLKDTNRQTHGWIIGLRFAKAKRPLHIANLCTAKAQFG